MGAELRSAVSMSHLRELPPEVLDALLAGSTRMTVLVGSVTHWEGEPEPHLELVLAGVVRVVRDRTRRPHHDRPLLPPGRVDRGHVPVRDRVRDAGDVSWLPPALLNPDGRPRHHDGAAPLPGVWYVGLRWLTHRASGNFLGFPADAAATADAVVTHLLVTVGGGR
jgi:hypothetical protein